MIETDQELFSRTHELLTMSREPHRYVAVCWCSWVSRPKYLAVLALISHARHMYKELAA